MNTPEKTEAAAVFGAEFLDASTEFMSGGGGGGWTCTRDIETGQVTCTNGKGLIKIT